MEVEKMSVKMLPISQNLPRNEVKNLFQKIAEIVRGVFEWFKSFFNRRILPVIEWMKKYEKDISRFKHNQYTRSTWFVNRDSRRKCQVLDNRPQFQVKKIIR